MNKTAWISVIVVAIVVGGGAFWGGMTYAQSQRPSFGGTGAAAFAARGTGTAGGAAFAGRAGGAGATIGTVLQVGNGSITVQLPTSTSTDATTGTKLILVGDQTQIQELESVSASSLKVGQSVTVGGTANSDGSITASSIQVRPTTTRGAGATSGQ